MYLNLRCCRVTKVPNYKVNGRFILIRKRTSEQLVPVLARNRLSACLLWMYLCVYWPTRSEEEISANVYCQTSTAAYCSTLAMYNKRCDFKSGNVAFSGYFFLMTVLEPILTQICVWRRPAHDRFLGSAGVKC